MSEIKGGALRYNTGKIRYGLIPENAKRELARVYTYGAHKYSLYQEEDGSIIRGADIPISEASKYKMIYDGSENWRNGTSWTAVLDSAQRHIEAYRSGEDIDELGTLHLSNAAWNLMTLMEYYYIYPEGDDRHHKYLRTPRIGLDIDDVLCDFIGGFSERFGLGQPENWAWTYKFDEYYKELLKDKKTFEQFFLNLKPLVDPKDIPFEPACYITQRSVPKEITQEWIEMHGFPCVPIYSIGHNESKLEVAKNNGIELFIDDRYDNFVELNRGGVPCLLFDSSHNRKYNVGKKRIYSLKEVLS